MTTATAIEVKALFDEWTDTPDWYYAKGHHDKAEFIKAAQERYRYDIDDLKPDDIEHCYARIVPALIDGYKCQTFIFQPNPARGAFPVTMFQVPDDMRHC